MFHPAPSLQNTSERKGGWVLREGRAGVKVQARGPTGNLTVGAGAALAAVPSTSAGPWDELLTAPAAALDSVLGT